MAKQSLFDIWWENHKEILQHYTKDKSLIEVVYMSAILDVADIIKEQRNDTPATGEEFYNFIMTLI